MFKRADLGEISASLLVWEQNLKANVPISHPQTEECMCNSSYCVFENLTALS